MSLEYQQDIEKLFKEEAEKAEGMSILHQKSYKKYSYYSVWINIPVIVLSSLVGFLSTIDMFSDQNYMIGGLSIFIAIIKTLDSYFSWTQRSENHRMMGLAYIKISKFIQIQLSLERRFRIRAEDMLKMIQNDLQNLRESENVIDDDIIASFNLQYKDETSAKPAICNGLSKIEIVVTEEKEEKVIDEKLPEEKPLENRDVQKNIKPHIWKR